MTKTDQRTETEKDRTPSRKTEKTPANHPDGTTEILKVHIRRFATKEQYKVKTVGRCKDLQLEQTGFQAVTCDSNVYRIQNLSKMPLSHKRKQKFLSKMPQWNRLVSCNSFGKFQTFKIQVLPTHPTNLTSSPLLRLATAAYAERYGSMTSRWCLVLAPNQPLFQG